MEKLLVNYKDEKFIVTLGTNIKNTFVVNEIKFSEEALIAINNKKRSKEFHKTTCFKKE